MTMPKFDPVATAMVNQHGTRWMHWKANLAHGTNLHSADQLTEAFEAGKRAQASELEAARAEIERLKTVPMRYRRMAFNAQLQDEVARLEQENDQLRAQINVLREAATPFTSPDVVDETSGTIPLMDALVKSLASTPEQSITEYRNKLIEQMIACYSPDDSAHDYFDKLNALKGQS